MLDRIITRSLQIYAVQTKISTSHPGVFLNFCNCFANTSTVNSTGKSFVNIFLGVKLVLAERGFVYTVTVGSVYCHQQVVFADNAFSFYEVFLFLRFPWFPTAIGCSLGYKKNKLRPCHRGSVGVRCSRQNRIRPFKAPRITVIGR